MAIALIDAVEDREIFVRILRLEMIVFAVTAGGLANAEQETLRIHARHVVDAFGNLHRVAGLRLRERILNALARYVVIQTARRIGAVAMDETCAELVIMRSPRDTGEKQWDPEQLASHAVSP